jgi:predicted nucleic acid-binding protein
VLKAKQAGVVPAVKPLIESLEDSHFYLSDSLKQAALRLAGE